MEKNKDLAVGVRGTVFIIFGEWVQDRLGKEKLDQLQEALPPNTAELLTKASRIKRYPLEKLLDVFEKSAAKIKLASWDEFGVYLCKFSLTTRFSDLTSYLDPETFMRRVPLFWSRYFDAGKIKIAELEEDRAFLKLTEPFGDERIIVMFTGWFGQALRMMRAEEIKVEGKDFSWALSWKWEN